MFLSLLALAAGHVEIARRAALRLGVSAKALPHVLVRPGRGDIGARAGIGEPAAAVAAASVGSVGASEFSHCILLFRNDDSW